MSSYWTTENTTGRSGPHFKALARNVPSHTEENHGRRVMTDTGSRKYLCQQLRTSCADYSGLSEHGDVSDGHREESVRDARSGEVSGEAKGREQKVRRRAPHCPIPVQSRMKPRRLRRVCVGQGAALVLSVVLPAAVYRSHTGRKGPGCVRTAKDSVALSPRANYTD
jgi:hypothetical protein